MAVDGVSLTVERGECVGVIGPNGSGKTTLFNCMSGRFPLTTGKVIWRGEDVTRRPMHAIAQRGLVRTFQEAKYFPPATVAENVELATKINRVRKHAPEDDTSTPDDLDGLLTLTRLEDVANQPASASSPGQLRKLGVAMALAARPQLLLLDEPAAGLNDAESAQLAEILNAVIAGGVTVMVIDHDMPFLLPLVDRVIVLSAGKVICEGSPEEVQRDPAVISVYLGTQLGQANGGEQA